MPRGATIFKESSCAFALGQAIIILSAPLPSVSSLTLGTGSSKEGFIITSGSTNFLAKLILDSASSIKMSFVAPFALASWMCIHPRGPAPTTTTTSPKPIWESSCPLIAQARGSARAASSKVRLSGRGLTHPFLTAFSGTAINSANPPL